MNDHKAPKMPPYQNLGTYLRIVRQKVQESLAEVSGAVEIDSDALERIEQGVELPSEDILMLLISHFGLGDDEAVSLWELAGYEQHADTTQEQSQLRSGEPQSMTKQPVVFLTLDTRVVYSNGIETISDKSGVVMNFTQYVDQAQGSVPVARVGMSYEQAEDVLAALQRAVLRGRYATGPKSLPQPKTSRKKSENTPEE
jgi:transcriptional regulator with XRE-family HTH domain